MRKKILTTLFAITAMLFLAILPSKVYATPRHTTSGFTLRNGLTHLQTIKPPVRWILQGRLPGKQLIRVITRKPILLQGPKPYPQSLSSWFFKSAAASSSLTPTAGVQYTIDRIPDSYTTHQVSATSLPEVRELKTLLSTISYHNQELQNPILAIPNEAQIIEIIDEQYPTDFYHASKNPFSPLGPVHYRQMIDFLHNPDRHSDLERLKRYMNFLDNPGDKGYAIQIDLLLTLSEEKIPIIKLPDYVHQELTVPHYPTKIVVEYDALLLKDQPQIVDEVKTNLYNLEPVVEDYDIEKLSTQEVSIGGLSYTRIIIPRKIKPLFPEDLSTDPKKSNNYKESNLYIDVETSYLDRIITAIKNLFSQGGRLTRKRIDRALKKVNVSSDAIINECQTFYFARKENIDGRNKRLG